MRGRMVLVKCGRGILRAVVLVGATALLNSSSCGTARVNDQTKSAGTFATNNTYLRLTAVSFLRPVNQQKAFSGYALVGSEREFSQ
jgi:hypothetical protein